jgi:hypothetical protein
MFFSSHLMYVTKCRQDWLIAFAPRFDGGVCVNGFTVQLTSHGLPVMSLWSIWTMLAWAMYPDSHELNGEWYEGKLLQSLLVSMSTTRELYFFLFSLFGLNMLHVLVWSCYVDAQLTGEASKALQTILGRGEGEIGYLPRLWAYLLSWAPNRLERGLASRFGPSVDCRAKSDCTTPKDKGNAWWEYSHSRSMSL